MIADILLILLAFVLGYVLFMASAYFLVKWLLPKIEDEEEQAISKSSQRYIRHTVKGGKLIARHA